MKKSPRQQLFYTDIWMSMSVWRHSTAKRFRFRRWIRVETAPLKLRPYGAIQMCLLLLFYYYSPEQGADLHMVQLMPLPLTVSCFSKIQIGFTFLVPAHPGSLGKRAVKRVCVQWRINHDANDAMAWGPPLKGAPRAAVWFFGMGPISLLIVLLDIDIFPMLSKWCLLG